MSVFESFMNDQIGKKQQEINKLRDDNVTLREALREAIDAIGVFHGPGWEIYRDHSPEMKRWKAALKAEPALAIEHQSGNVGKKSTKEDHG
jgi:hypothetical protein